MQHFLTLYIQYTLAVKRAAMHGAKVFECHEARELSSHVAVVLRRACAEPPQEGMSSHASTIKRSG